VVDGWVLVEVSAARQVERAVVTGSAVVGEWAFVGRCRSVLSICVAEPADHIAANVPTAAAG